MLELRKVSILACVVAMHFSIVVTARGEISASNDGEAASIRAKAQQYLEAKRSGNAAAIREFWTSSGDYVDAVGQVFKPGDLNPQTSAPTVPGSAAEAPVAQSSLRFITPEVAIEDGTYEMGTDDDGSELAGRYTAIWVRSRGTWLLDSLREAMPLSPPANSRLQPLDWLLGERVGTTDDATILVSSHWADGGKYIVREFLVRRARGETVVGTQRIGWDPIAGKIKCWSFDSQGGSGEGYWRQEGERWVVDSADVTADGTKSQTSAAYTPSDDGSFVWEAVSPSARGANLPGGRIEFKRAAVDD